MGCGRHQWGSVLAGESVHPFHGLGLHLQEKHEIWIDDTEIPEEGMLLRDKETQAVLATWQELTPERTTNESRVTDQ